MCLYVKKENSCERNKVNESKIIWNSIKLSRMMVFIIFLHLVACKWASNSWDIMNYFCFWRYLYWSAVSRYTYLGRKKCISSLYNDILNKTQKVRQITFNLRSMGLYPIAKYIPKACRIIWADGYSQGGKRVSCISEGCPTNQPLILPKIDSGETDWPIFNKLDSLGAIYWRSWKEEAVGLMLTSSTYH